MKILIKITKEILRQSAHCQNTGTSQSTMIGQNCAIGKAVHNLFGNHSWVGCTSIDFFMDEINFGSCGDYVIRLPMEAILFIGVFDKSTPEERMEMPQLAFEIDVPQGVIDQIGIGQVYKVLSESKSLEHVNS